VAADHPRYQAVVAQVVETALLAVALPGGIDQGQVARRADALGIRLAAFDEALFQRDRDVLGKTDADEAAGRHRVAIANQAHRVAGGNDLAGIGTGQRGGDGVLRGRHGNSK
jgi:hypothetical protein